MRRPRVRTCQGSNSPHPILHSQHVRDRPPGAVVTTFTVRRYTDEKGPPVLRSPRQPDPTPAPQIPPHNDLRLLNSKEVARRLSVSLRTFERWVATGIFPGVDLRIGRTVRWKTTTVDRWIADQDATGGRRAAS